ncbi:unnamed protein product [Rotaria sordida]|uniref:RNA-directed RNA polymerase n=1 Tax=Rotaria sordida TaxID=392033 RepID=A0A813Z6I2_9BILA|nr:unnamed protein product [Rotaria sordida]CAF3755131.1 unnamed protein product [Rotaria sordida]
MSVYTTDCDEDNPFNNSPSDEDNESELVELQAEGFADYVHRLDTEQNERLQEEEQEIVRLWKARNNVLSQLEFTKEPNNDNISISEVESPYDDNESIISQQTNYSKCIKNGGSKSSCISFSTRLRNKPSIITSPPPPPPPTTSSFVNRNINNRNGYASSITSNDPYDDRSSGVGSLILSPVQSPVMWRSEKVLGRGLCSSSIDYNHMNIGEGHLVKPYSRTNTYSESDAFKDIDTSKENGYFATMRARMEATAASTNSNNTPISFDDQYINPPLLSNTKKSHFDYDEEFNYHQTYILPKLIQEEKERRKQETTIDFSFKIGLDEPITNINSDGTIIEDEPYLSIIVDNNNNGLKRVCSIFDQHQLVYDRENILHDQWCYGLISYTFLLKQSVKIVNSSVMKLLQQQLKHNDTFWLSNGLKKRPIFNDSFFNIDETSSMSMNGITSISTTNCQTTGALIETTRLNKYRQLARCFFYVNCQMEWSSGALIAMNLFSPYEKLSKQPNEKWELRFREDFVDFIYQTKEKSNPKYEYIKRLQANFIDKSVIITTNSDGFVLYIQMKGNIIELINYEPWWVARKHREQNKPVMTQRQAIQRQAHVINPLPFCSTIRISIKVSRVKDSSQRKNDRRYKNQTIDDYEFRMDCILINNIRVAFREFLAFFYRHRIQICFAGSIIDSSFKLSSYRIEQPVFNTFIKNYSWQMLLSLGYRFQQQVTQKFIDYLKTIEADDEFYQIALYIWRRAKEYHFVNTYEELMKYTGRQKENNHDRRTASSHVSSLMNPTRNRAHAPSVTITPTTICVKPFKLAKTNRVIREPKFGGVSNFCLVEIREETGDQLQANYFGTLRSKIDDYLKFGFKLTNDRNYRHLHHSQSQLKDKQYWFYWHDEKNKTNPSFDEAYKWMGDFENERVVAKHSARIAQCFTSSEATIRVLTEKTEIIDDIERNGYIFTDGVGTFSSRLRDEICSKMGYRRKFSVMQIRYGGCKGTVSVNPNLDYTEKQLILRKSMHKFISKHDMLELCKVSAPRPIHLNRQVIALLESRHIPHSTFLLLQNQHLLSLVESLLYLPSTYELLHERLPPHLQLRDLIFTAQIDLIHEPFFRQLITTMCKYEIKRIQDKTRIQISKNSGRNMFGIVDETATLQYGQVFCQYTVLDTEQLENFTRTNNIRSYNQEEIKKVVVGKIVVTKNPCHHPGDLRTFEAVDVPKLRHLVDCIVFPQLGERPHPNEISGSDLDGDEYAVFWHPDLIPTTENFPPYEYDSQEKPQKLNRPVTRDDIRQIVLEISEQDALGRLSNLHLAYTDKYNIRHRDAMLIAAAIAEEVDAAKTGKHPLTENEIAELAHKLDNERADFFNRPKQFNLYASSNAIGILFRAIRRSEPGWLKINRCLHTKTTIGLIQSSHISAHVQIDPLLVHSLSHLYHDEAEDLFKIYHDQISDIMYVYHFHSEVDLICKFDSQQQMISKQIDIADSAQVELTRLMNHIKNLFNDSKLKNGHPLKCLCEDCDERRMARASACYIVTYEQPYTKKILSFAWLFSSWLVKLRRANLEKQNISYLPSNYFLVGQALFRSFLLLIENQSLRFIVDFNSSLNKDSCLLQLNYDIRIKKSIYIRVHLMEWAMLEIITGWLDRQEIFSTGKNSSKTAMRPTILLRTWKHITTQFVFAKYQPKICSELLLLQNRFLSKQQLTITNDKGTTVNLTLPKFASSASISSFPSVSSWWSDEMACQSYKLFLNLTAQCSQKHTLSDSSKRMDMAHLNEYLTLGLLVIAAENEFGNVTWQLLIEGKLAKHEYETSWIIEQLLNSSLVDNQIRLTALSIFSLESYLYPLIQTTLRTNDMSKISSFSPFFALFGDCRAHSFEIDCLLFCATKNRSMAEQADNVKCLFIVHIKRQRHANGIDISSLSRQSQEQETLI